MQEPKVQEPSLSLDELMRRAEDSEIQLDTDGQLINPHTFLEPDKQLAQQARAQRAEMRVAEKNVKSAREAVHQTLEQSLNTLIPKLIQARESLGLGNYALFFEHKNPLKRFKRGGKSTQPQISAVLFTRPLHDPDHVNNQKFDSLTKFHNKHLLLIHGIGYLVNFGAQAPFNDQMTPTQESFSSMRRQEAFPIRSAYHGGELTFSLHGDQILVTDKDNKTMNLKQIAELEQLEPQEVVEFIRKAVDQEKDAIQTDQTPDNTEQQRLEHTAQLIDRQSTSLASTLDSFGSSAKPNSYPRQEKPKSKNSARSLLATFARLSDKN